MATTTNYGWTTPDDTDLVKDGAAAIRSLGTAIDTTVFNNAGAAIAKTLIDAKGDLIAGSAADTAARLAVGTNDHRLVAASGEATGLKYVADTQNTVIDAAGDLVYGTAADTLGRLAIGTAGQVLTVNSGATAPEWAAPAAGGKVLQVVQGTLTNTTTIASSTYTDVNLSATITPAAATSKIAIFIACNVNVDRFGNRNGHCGARIMRDSTAVLTNDRCIEIDDTDAPTFHGNTFQNAWNYVDSPSTTSAITYKLQGKQNQSVNSYWNQKDSTSTATIILMEIGA